MSFKLKCLNNTYMSFIKSFNDKQRYYKSLIWVRFMRRVKAYGFQLRNKKKWRIISYCQALNGYRVDFITYHTLDAVFRAKVDRKKAEKERKALDKRNKKKVVLPTNNAHTLSKRKDRLDKLNYVSRDDLLNFKLLSNLLKTTNQSVHVADVADDVNDDDEEASYDSRYSKLVSKYKTSNKKIIKKRAHHNTKYSHLVNQFFKSKQRTNEGLEVNKLKTFHELDARIQLLIRVKLRKYQTYYKERKYQMDTNVVLRILEKRKLRGFDFLKFKNLLIKGVDDVNKGKRKYAQSVKSRLS